MGKLATLFSGLRARAKISADRAPVEISYTPDLDGAPDPGEVVWAWVSYEEDPSQGKDRPVVIIGERDRRFAAVALTSRDRSDEFECVAVGSGLWDSQRRPSFAKLDRILWFDGPSIRREGAILDRQAFVRLIDRLREVHGWTDR